MQMLRRCYVITGAGSGIGRATAIRFSKHIDAHLILIGRNRSTLDATLNMCENRSQHHANDMDIRDAEAWKRLWQDLNNNELNLCGVFANAGEGGENHYGDKRWSEIIDINLNGTYTTIMECLPHLKSSKDKFRHVVITSSCLARFGVPRYSAYCTSKTGLLGLTRSLALEFAEDQILVNAICPGWVDSEMANASMGRLASHQNKSLDTVRNEQAAMVPLQRISNPDEIAALVEFLFRGEQSSITGQAIDVNNGSFMS
ncbi:MAG: SDR family oxidoreductase [Flavobacteriales bacterium]